MTEYGRPLLSDNPSDHDALILLVQRFSSYMESDRSWKRETGQTLQDLAQKVGLQNGSVATLTHRANQHDSWHGTNDEHIASRVGTLWDEREAGLIRRGVYLSAWKAVAWLIAVAGSFGIGGLLLGKLI